MGDRGEIRELVRRRTTPLAPDEVSGWLARLTEAGDPAELGAAQQLDVITVLERLKNAAAAAQARASVAFEAAQRPDLEAGNVAPAAISKSIGGQLALARRESPHRGSRHLGLAKALVREMPHTYAALRRGSITEWTATLLVQATACLTVADRAEVDARLAPRLGVDSDRQLRRAAEEAAYALDPSAWVARGRKAVQDRRVTCRAAPDVMAIVSGYVPAAQGVACFKALDDHAKALRSGGDTRSLDQIKADTFVERITGQVTASAVPVEVGLVMTDTTLLGAEDRPARLEGYGALPAALALDLLEPLSCGDDAGSTAEVWVRRLFTDPHTGQVTSTDSRRRRFSGGVRQLLLHRDQTCRTPYCDAPIRHLDHVRRWSDGGRTEATNGQGLCEACNYTFEAPGWSKRASTAPDGTHTVQITTPTGHTYTSQPPPALGGLGDRAPGHRDRSAGRGSTELDDTG